VWINNSTEGSIQLRWQPLPLEAQVSPCFGVIAADLFGGGSPSLAMVQNLFSREPETGLWRGGLGCIFQLGSGVLSPGGHEQGKPTALPSRRSGFVVAGDGKALAVADVNADGRPDLVATQNNGPLLAFEQQAQTQDSPLVAVRLAGPPGNPAGCGARVKLLVDDQVVASAEVHGGSGYLSQSASTVYFRRPVDENSARMVVEWPGGNVTTAGLSPDQATVVVPAP
jgi:hypothetical protein